MSEVEIIEKKVTYEKYPLELYDDSAQNAASGRNKDTTSLNKSLDNIESRYFGVNIIVLSLRRKDENKKKEKDDSQRLNLHVVARVLFNDCSSIRYFPNIGVDSMSCTKLAKIFSCLVVIPQ